MLSAVEQDKSVTQRSIAKQSGIALGLVNSYIKRCVKKGLIKIQQAPANRYAYYLTPQGFSEKSRLAREYLSQGFQFFRIAREQCSEIFQACHRQGFRRIALHGLTDLAEIAVLCSKGHDIELVAIIDPSTQLTSYSGIPIVVDMPSAGSLDAIVVTDLGNPQREYEKLAKAYGRERVFAPAILKVAAGRLGAAEESGQ